MVGGTGTKTVDAETYEQVKAAIDRSPTPATGGVFRADLLVWQLCSASFAGQVTDSQFNLVAGLAGAEFTVARARQIAQLAMAGRDKAIRGEIDLAISDSIITNCELWRREEGQKLLER